jgi:hypothetical protein
MQVSLLKRRRKPASRKWGEARTVNSRYFKAANTSFEVKEIAFTFLFHL